MNHIAYYNEIDPFAAQWLRNLIDAGHIAPGVVDERSITEVTPDDVKGFRQCHFFAGIGGWPLALHLAGFDERHRIWTGSPPCQPFSTAGKQLGQLDERHLAPTFMRLVAQCRPSILFGEQVAAAISKYWLDDLFTELEGEGYACGAAVLPACSVGAPHKRDRLYFGARLLADGVGVGSFRGRLGKERAGQNQRRQASVGSSEKHRIKGLCSAGGMAHANDAGLERRERVPECSDQQLAGASGLAGGLADSVCAKCDGERLQRSAESDGPKGGRPPAKSSGCGNSDKSGHSADPFCAGADWLSCRDGKFRPVESGAFPLAHGISARVGRLRGYGNAIVPQVAAQFITAFLAACND